MLIVRVVGQQQRLLVCLASVFCASGRTMILPLKTARAWSAEHALVQLVAGAVRLRVVEVVWLSMSCVPRPT